MSIQYNYIETVLDVYAANNLTGNAFCQDLGESIWPLGALSFAVACQPEYVFNRVSHGASVAELVRDVAPNAVMSYAQANSPRQVYDAAQWLTTVRNVDVIVHAGGWTYDGPGDGTSPLGQSKYLSTVGVSGGNTHSAYRYYPSVLNTVQAFAGSWSGPVWINAAGNQELLTFRTANLQLQGGTTDYANFLVLDPDAPGIGNLAAQNRTCLPVPKDAFGMYMYSLRWGDNWSNPSRDLDMFVSARTRHPTDWLTDTFMDTANDQDQMPENHPYRRAIKLSGRTDIDQCLRIRVNANSAEARVLPPWLQFQILTTQHGTNSITADTAMDGSGHSIVNPASSPNNNLLAVAARDFRSSGTRLMPYSSRGPVFVAGANVETGHPVRIEPDVASPSGALTYTTWATASDDCRTNNCDDLYFDGTSAATGHMGGIAALVTQLFDDVGNAYWPAHVTSYIKRAATAIETTSSGRASHHPNDRWGNGYVQLPCRQKVVSFPYSGSVSDEWAVGDCVSVRRANSYADYFTFRLTSAQRVEIALTSSVDTCLYLANGLFTGDIISRASDDNDGSGTNSRITTTGTLPKGVYTVEASTKRPTSTGDYTLTIRTPSAPTWTASLSPNPSSATIRSDGAWHRFTVSSGGDVKVVVNPTGTPARLEITNSAGTGNICPPESNDPATVSHGGYVYLSGCSAGAATVELRRASNNSLIRTYNMTVSAPPQAMCEPVTNMTARRTSGTSVYVQWSNPSTGLTGTGRQVTVIKYVNSRWVNERVINEPANRTSSWHLGLDPEYMYAYRVRSLCSSNASAYTSWATVGLQATGQAMDDGEDNGEVVPTPSAPTGPSDVEETPPEPQP